uniref:EOG090X0CWG n=1 Tax=Lynceus sp. MCZ IZ 141354 TaxID=1930659 RepID=A0A9N6WT39_9CRUS|nr:EOG090X0CWG [Lynceus sp. MCZ IZ 141354]
MAEKIESSDAEIRELIHNRIKEGYQLQSCLKHYSSVSGAGKLERRITAEIKFLEKLLKSGNPKREHVSSSNLQSLAAIVNLLSRCNEPVALLRSFPIGDSERIVVDIVSNGGSTWNKVIARNPEALLQITFNKCYGQKSIVDQAGEYLKAASRNLHLFQRVIVEGERQHIDEPVCIDDTEDTESDEEDVSTPPMDATQRLSLQFDAIEKSEEDRRDVRLSINDACLVAPDIPLIAEDCVFLDLTAIVTYVSNITNGGTNFIFDKPIYNQQAEWERLQPVKPKLEQLFTGKILLTCQTAMREFEDLINVIGGPRERQRWDVLRKQIIVTKDILSPRFEDLPLSASVKERSRVIFGTADALQVVIITANTSFVRSAAEQGVNIAAFLHEARVLTEMKEKTACPL